jgi:hypothetical protein
MQSHLGSVVWCLASIAWLGLKFFGAFTRTVGKSVQTSAECKIDRSAVLMVMSGLDPHMINKLKDEIKSWFDELWEVLL